MTMRRQHSARPWQTSFCKAKTKQTWIKQKPTGMLTREKGMLKQQTRHSSHAHSWFSREHGQITNRQTVWGDHRLRFAVSDLRSGRTSLGSLFLSSPFTFSYPPFWTQKWPALPPLSLCSFLSFLIPPKGQPDCQPRRNKTLFSSLSPFLLTLSRPTFLWSLPFFFQFQRKKQSFLLSLDSRMANPFFIFLFLFYNTG